MPLPVRLFIGSVIGALPGIALYRIGWGGTAVFTAVAGTVAGFVMMLPGVSKRRVFRFCVALTLYHYHLVDERSYDWADGDCESDASIGPDAESSDESMTDIGETEVNPWAAEPRMTTGMLVSQVACRTLVFGLAFIVLLVVLDEVFTEAPRARPEYDLETFREELEQQPRDGVRGEAFRRLLGIDGDPPPAHDAKGD